MCFSSTNNHYCISDSFSLSPQNPFSTYSLSPQLPSHFQLMIPTNTSNFSQQLARSQHLQQLHRIPRQRLLLPHTPTHLLHRVLPRGLRLTLPSIPHKRQFNQQIEVRNHLPHRRFAFLTASLVFGATLGSSLRTRDTVATETLA